jgi:MYXO-CTERM domain-containing protein
MLTTAVRDSLRSPMLRALLSTVAALLSASACVAPPDGIELQRGAALDICATAPEGALCDDKNVCTVFDVCKAGICKGSAAPDGTLCTDGNVCTVNDSCRIGVCKGDPVPDTTACTDGDPCTVGDVCKAGLCVTGPGMLACNDGIACTLDVCVAGVGCIFSPVGDCSVPKDAGPEAGSDAADGKPPDVGSDVAGDGMPGGDVASDRPVVTDAPVDGAPPDVIAADVPAPVDAPPDASGAETSPGADGGVDAPDGAAAIDADAGDAADASEVADGGVEAKDAGTVVTPLVLRASGGACACETAQGPRSRWTLLALGAMAVLARRRRKTGGSRAHR